MLCLPVWPPSSQGAAAGGALRAGGLPVGPGGRPLAPPSSQMFQIFDRRYLPTQLFFTATGQQQPVEGGREA